MVSEWAKTYRQASFRGVKFFVLRAEETGGRAIVNHEFAERDEPYVEDMGKVGYGFPLVAHVIGDDYLEQKENLVAALIKKGPGVLIHPYIGRMKVNSGPYSIIETVGDQRHAIVNLNFFESGEYLYPIILIDIKADLLTSVTDSLSALDEMVQAALDIAKMPGALVDAVGDLVGFVGDVFDRITAPFEALADIAAELSYSIRTLKADVNDLLAAPGELVDRLNEAFDLVAGALTSPEDRVAAYKDLLTVGNDFETPTVNTDTMEQHKKNVDSIRDYVQTAAITHICKHVIDVDFESLEAAETEREFIVDYIEEKLLDEETSIEVSDDTYQALRDMIANIVQALPDENSELPTVIEYVPRESMPSLLIAYEVFQDPGKEQDIIDRNDIEHPGFVPGGETLELLG